MLKAFSSSLPLYCTVDWCWMQIITSSSSVGRIRMAKGNTSVEKRAALMITLEAGVIAGPLYVYPCYHGEKIYMK